MNFKKIDALNKMHEEMKKDHSSAEDSIHNWLCDQHGDQLLSGILKPNKTIKEALQYCLSQASKNKTGTVAMIDDDTVFSWVKDYFLNDSVVITNVKAQVSTVNKPLIKPKKQRNIFIPTNVIPMKGEQLSLLDDLI